jgi:hypothetical protein
LTEVKRAILEQNFAKSDFFITVFVMPVVDVPSSSGFLP